MYKIVIWGSGEGTTLEYVYDQIACGQLSNYSLVGAITDEPESPFCAKALARGVPRLNRSAFTWEEIQQGLRELEPNLMILAGYLEVLPTFVLEERLTINIHPSYLPEFPGRDPQRQALEARAPFTGVTIHRVTTKVDAGPIIARYRVPVLESETLESLERRLKLASYRLLSMALEEELWKEKANKPERVHSVSKEGVTG